MTRDDHEFDQLAAFAESQLDDGIRARVATHIEACMECRRAYEEIRRGIALAAEIDGGSMALPLAAAMRERFVNGEMLTVRRRWHHVGVWSAAAVLLFAVGILLYWQAHRPWAELRAADAEPTAFEQQGREIHRSFAAGAPVDFAAARDPDLWRWLAEEGAPVTSIRPAHAPEDASRFVPVGAAVRTVAGAKASVLSYRVDGRPVTLVLAHARDVTDAPPPGWWKKRVTHRRDANGANILTWTVGGGTYVLVSELEDYGQRACFVCHTDRRFQQAIGALSRR